MYNRFFAAPNNASNIPENHVPEIFFNNIRQCLIPNFDYDDEKIDFIHGGANGNNDIDQNENYVIKSKILSDITSHESCNGALLTFSFQVEQVIFM